MRLALSTRILPYAQYNYDDGEPDGDAEVCDANKLRFAVVSSNIVIKPPAMKSHFLCS